MVADSIADCRLAIAHWRLPIGNEGDPFLTCDEMLVES